MLGTVRPELLDFLAKVGVSLIDTPQKANLWIIDIENVTAEDLQKLQPVLKKWQKKGGMLLALSSGSKLSDAFCKWLPEDVKLTDRRASALETNKNTAWGSYFELPDLYFGEMDGDRLYPETWHDRRTDRKRKHRVQCLTYGLDFVQQHCPNTGSVHRWFCTKP